MDDLHAIRKSIRIDPLGLAQASLKGYLSTTRFLVLSFSRKTFRKPRRNAVTGGDPFRSTNQPDCQRSRCQRKRTGFGAPCSGHCPSVVSTIEMLLHDTGMFQLFLKNQVCFLGTTPTDFPVPCPRPPQPPSPAAVSFSRRKPLDKRLLRTSCETRRRRRHTNRIPLPIPRIPFRRAFANLCRTITCEPIAKRDSALRPPVLPSRPGPPEPKSDPKRRRRPYRNGRQNLERQDVTYARQGHPEPRPESLIMRRMSEMSQKPGVRKVFRSDFWSCFGATFFRGPGGRIEPVESGRHGPSGLATRPGPMFPPSSSPEIAQNDG